MESTSTPTTREPGAETLRTASLDAEARAALDALTESPALADPVAIATAAMLKIPLFLTAGVLPRTRPRMGRARELARLLVHHAFDGADAPSAAALRVATEALAEEPQPKDGDDEEEGDDEAGGENPAEPADRALLPEKGEDLEFDRLLQQAMLREVNTLLNEVGLEELGLDLELAFEGDGTPVLAGVPMLPAMVHVRLLDYLYPRVELALNGDSLLRLERRASRWWLERWSSPVGEKDAWRYNWRLREREYSLVERETIALEEPIMRAFLRQEFFAEVPARQQRMARGLDGSYGSAFRVREQGEGRLLLEELDGGRHFEVHEHNQRIEYAPDFLAVGRLLPFEEDRFLRSPGMAFLKPSGTRTAEVLVEGLESARESVGFGVAAEALLATLAGRGGVPRRVVPAESPQEAKLLLESFREAMQAHELLEPVAEEEAPEGLREQARQAGAGEGLEFFQMPVDEPVAEWVAALREQSRAARTGAKRAGKSRKKGKKRR